MKFAGYILENMEAQIVNACLERGSHNATRDKRVTICRTTVSSLPVRYKNSAGRKLTESSIVVLSPMMIEPNDEERTPVEA